MLLANKTALITGAAAERSIGLAAARLFIEQGARVALVDIDNAALQHALASLPVGQRAYACDVVEQAQCRETIQQAVDDLGGIDILVNSAGLVFGTPILEISEQEYQRVMDVNLRGTFNMSQAVIEPMLTRGGGAIVCVASIAGQNGGGVFGRSHYAASKAGIMGLAKALGRELAPQGIRVNAVAPGPVDNDFSQGKMTAAMKQQIAGNVPLGRLGTPTDIANACLFLASGMSAWITGAVLDVNGGLLIH
jgi:NAD(P)-dependent dehydrogenase (short-subunit alcohol dehydrogenase family)